MGNCDEHPAALCDCAQVSLAYDKGEEISLNCFGKFKVKDTPEREGRDPASGEAMTIKAVRKLSLQFGSLRE